MSESETTIKLKTLLQILQSAYDKHASKTSCQEAIKVEFLCNGQYFVVSSIGQFGVKPDVIIELTKVSDAR